MNPMLIEEHLKPEAECLNHDCTMRGKCQHYMFGTFNPDTAFSPRLKPNEQCGYFLSIEDAS